MTDLLPGDSVSDDHFQLAEVDVQKLLEFVGYGNPDGRFWFVGMEEAGDLKPAELLTRAREFHVIDDLARAHALPGYLTDMTKLRPTWSAMSRLVLRLSGEANWRDRDLVRWYQMNRLGRANGETFLTEALPLPCPSTAQWPYESLFATRDMYRGKLLRRRLGRLRALFDQHRPQYVFCYGKDYWAEFQQVFAGAAFEDIEPGRVRVAHTKSGTVVLTHFFSSWFMTDERIDRIAAQTAGLERLTAHKGPSPRLARSTGSRWTPAMDSTWSYSTVEA
jgi:hypothetical protein